MAENTSRYDRSLNQKALGKKSREKNRSVRRKEAPSETTASWSDFEAQKRELTQIGIVSSVRDRTLKLMDNTQTWEATLDEGIPAKLSARLVVGDKVFFRTSNGETTGIIEARQPRTSVLARFKGDRKRVTAGAQEEQIIAANVDVAVIVVAKCHPDFHPRFVDRYLVICENGGITPLVCINKSDLSEDLIPAIQWYRSAGITVIETSITTGMGIDALKQAIQGKVAVLVGNSGVGKSSLINAILGTHLETKAVSEKTGKGKHTTTASSLYCWMKNSYLIDTPGIRSLGVFHIDKTNLQVGFPEFAHHTTDCQYTDCTHSHEPLCGVKKAIESGDVSEHRYESYLRMLEE